MDENIESQDSALENTDGATKEPAKVEAEQDSTDWKAEAAKWKRIATKAEKAKTEEAPKSSSNNNDASELDWGQKAFLKSSGIQGSDELALVRDYMKRTGEPLDAVVEDDIFQGKLTRLRDTKTNEIAALGKSGRGNTNSDPVAKVMANLNPNDPIPPGLPRDVREKIVELRRTSGAHAKMFYND